MYVRVVRVNSHRARTQAERVNDSITFRDIGGTTIPWRDKPLYHHFRYYTTLHFCAVYY
jgi:phosphoribulokinase